MKTLHKYIFKQYISYICIILCSTLGILVSLVALKNNASYTTGSASFGQLFYFIILLLPMLIPYILPFCFTLSTAFCCRELSQSKEYLALLSSGISKKSIIKPLWIIGIFGILLSLTFQFKIAPDSHSFIKQYFQESAIHNPAQFLSTKTFMYKFPGYVLYIDDINDNKLSDFCIWKYNNDNKLETVISSSTGKIIYNDKTQSLDLQLQNGNICTKIEDLNNLSFISFKNFEINLPINSILSDKPDDIYNKKTKYMNLSELLELKHDAQIKNNYQQYIASFTQINMNIVMSLVIFAIIALVTKTVLQADKKDSISDIVITILTTIAFYVFVLIISSLIKRPHCRPDLLIWLPLLLMWSCCYLLNRNK